MDEETPEEALKRLGIARNRWRAWINAAEAHVWPKPGSTVHLAALAKAWREYEAIKADRLFKDHGISPIPKTEETIGLPAAPKLDEVTEFELRTRAETFEALYTRAFDLKDHKFCNRLAEAFLIPDDKISQKVSAYGAVVFIWKELGGLTGKRPNRQAIRSRLESIPGAPEITERHWERIWSDPFISALLRCR